MSQAQEAELGVNFTNPDLESGPTNALSLKRTFGSKEPIRYPAHPKSRAGTMLKQTNDTACMLHMLHMRVFCKGCKLHSKQSKT